MPAKQKAKRKRGPMETCACGYESDWPPAMARHKNACKAPVPEGAIESEDLNTDEPAEAREAEQPTNAAGGPYCRDIEECREDLDHTPCGADPCGLVADEAKARAASVDLEERLEGYEASESEPQRRGARVTLDVTPSVTEILDRALLARDHVTTGLRLELLDALLRNVEADLPEPGLAVDVLAALARCRELAGDLLETHRIVAGIAREGGDVS